MKREIGSFAPSLLVRAAAICVAATAAFAQAASYTYEFQAYSQGNLVDSKTVSFEAIDNHEATKTAGSKLAVWNQELTVRGVTYNRTTPKFVSKVPPDGAQVGAPIAGPPAKLTAKVTIVPDGVLTAHNGEWAGTKGKGLMMEELSVSMSEPIAKFELQYMAHIEQKGDTQFVQAGTPLRGAYGRTDITVFGFSKNYTPPERIEGVAFRLVGPDAAQYSVRYRGHIENLGTTEWCKDGEYCGTRGRGLRLEAFQVDIVPN